MSEPLRVLDLVRAVTSATEPASLAEATRLQTIGHMVAEGFWPFQGRNDFEGVVDGKRAEATFTHARDYKSAIAEFISISVRVIDDGNARDFLVYINAHPGAEKIAISVAGSTPFLRSSNITQLKQLLNGVSAYESGLRLLRACAVLVVKYADQQHAHAAAEPETKSAQGEELVRKLEKVFYALVESLRKKPNTVFKLDHFQVPMSLAPDHGFRDPEIILNGPFRLRLICPSLSGYSHIAKLFLMDDHALSGTIPFNGNDTLNRKFMTRILLAYQKACLERSRWNIAIRGGPVPAPQPPGRFRLGHGRPR